MRCIGSFLRISYECEGAPCAVTKRLPWAMPMIPMPALAQNRYQRNCPGCLVAMLGEPRAGFPGPDLLEPADAVFTASL